MIQKIQVSLFVGLLCLISSTSYAHVDGVHTMSLLDGLVHFLTQPSHVFWVILAAFFGAFYCGARVIPRLYRNLRVRANRDE